LAALSTVMGSVCGQDDDFDPLGEREYARAAKMVRCAVELIEVPTTFLSEAVAEEAQTLPNDERQWRKARELATKGEAELLDCIVVQTKPGLPTRVGSNLEKLYATEYDPPPVPKAEEKKDTAKTDSPPKQATPALVAPVPQMPVLPVAFDTRSVGCTVDMDPVVGPTGDIVDLTISVENVTDIGEEILGTWKDEKAEIAMKMPKFHLMQVKTQVTVPDGHVILLGAASPPDAEGKTDSTRKVLVFAKVDIVTTADRRKP
jgi:hypothetical protein